MGRQADDGMGERKSGAIAGCHEHAPSTSPRFARSDSQPGMKPWMRT
jgi:hypothetical protein